MTVYELGSVDDVARYQAKKLAKEGDAAFARVPAGTEMRAFCLMLASRGAVYHTRKTAGERGHFHRGCDCKVAPSFEGDGTIKNLHVIYSDGIIETLNKKDAGLGS